ncbi:PREDICTED: lethal(3)malignant brain tumor-like protein 4 isoform X3 [Cyprinodon variegatus]|uniref:lethal(3)malignant brain tumor-like protein 4 isoform X3 n=1 Tax=Cyprinodon variegatus TaxID=28743 RepID=UPI0007428CB0|nr:PREDICTED: lethal(3)malignant brain tumor-like protein 4 isoform X3 [Cyprinodon variegatus]
MDQINNPNLSLQRRTVSLTAESGSDQTQTGTLMDHHEKKKRSRLIRCGPNRTEEEEEEEMKNKVSSTQVSVKRRSWSWQQYLNEQKAEAAPPSVFTQEQSFPSRRAAFKAGMKLEGVDPLHPSMFCVLTVAEVIGCRLRLHIDGYSECYDFWVNADSADIKPAGWCKEHSHKLHPPKGQSEAEFDWQDYLQSTGSHAAPASLFTRRSTDCAFQVGMKLEAVDKKNPGLVCVASVADVVEERFLVHFDNWDDTYDYWCDSSSPYIHPVGWCEEHGRPLTAPQGHPSPEHFVWDDYLQETGSMAAPGAAFTLRAPHGFKLNHRLEAVDRRNPMLMRVATVTDTEDYRVKIHYDGWSTLFDVWLDSDHGDLHPVGWCQRTGHPLEPPPGSTPLPSPSQGVCPTAGCRGVGHIKGAKYTGHHSAFGCPYSDINMRKEVVLPDRLGGERSVTLVPVSIHQQAYLPHRRAAEEKEEESPEAPLLLPLGKRKRPADRLSQPTKLLRVKQEEEEVPLRTISPAESSLQAALHQSVFLSAMSPQPGRDLSLCWEQHRKLLPGVARIPADAVQCWSVQQVSDFIESLPGCEEQAQQFREEQIDGRAFLLLTQRDIVRIMSIKLGPALKIYNSILMFKHAEEKSQSQTEGKNSQSQTEDKKSQSQAEDESQSQAEDESQSQAEDESQSQAEDESQSQAEDESQSQAEDESQSQAEDESQSDVQDYSI